MTKLIRVFWIPTAILKKSAVHLLFMVAVSGVVISCQSPAQTAEKATWAEIAWAESTNPIHPGIPGKSPFWNGYAQRFIYAPAFDYKDVQHAVRYRYDIVSLKNDSTYHFEQDIPYAPLSPVWARVPVGHFKISVIGLSTAGDSVGLAGQGKYYRAAPFRGAYHEPPALPYDSSARIALHRLMHKDYVNYWLTHKSPDPEYSNYRYPAKIMSALIVGAITHARLMEGTDEAQRSTDLAKIVADYLISISYPKSSIWPDFPPSYHGPRIGKNPDSHMQLVNNMTIIGADAGNAYLDLFDLTGDEKYLEAAKKVAQTYVNTQLDNGSWYLYVNHETGKPIAENIAIPTAPVSFFNRLQRNYQVDGSEQARVKAVEWIMRNPVATFNWHAQFEDVRPAPPFKRLSREQACDMAIYLFKNGKDIKLAEELVRFSEDQFVIWEQPEDFSVKPKNKNPGWSSKNWITPSVQEQYGFWMPVNRSAGIMIQAYWEAYAATKKEIYLAKAKSIANAITVVQEANDGDYPTMFIRTPWHLWLNSTVYPARVMMTLQEDLEELRQSEK